MASILNADTSNGLKITSDTSGEIKLQSAGTDTVTVKSDGKVGIGTTTPSVKLDVVTTASDDGGQITGGATGANLYLNNTGTGGKKYRIYSTGSSNAVGAGFLGFYDETAGSLRMGIDSSGRITTPYQPMFRAYQGSSSISGGNTIIFTSTNFNVGGHYNTSNGQFTAPVTGYYMFFVSGLFLNGSSSPYKIDWQKNGSQDALALEINNNYFTSPLTFSNTVVASLAANDTFRLYNASGSANISGVQSKLGGYLIG